MNINQNKIVAGVIAAIVVVAGTGYWYTISYQYKNNTMTSSNTSATDLSEQSVPMGKRAAPQETAPIEYQGMRFEAPTRRVGYVQAHDIKTDKLIWEKQIYTVKYNPDLETDVQEVFITKLSIEGGALVVENEKGQKYNIDPQTGEAK